MSVHACMHVCMCVCVCVCVCAGLSKVQARALRGVHFCDCAVHLPSLCWTVPVCDVPHDVCLMMCARVCMLACTVVCLMMCAS